MGPPDRRFTAGLWACIWILIAAGLTTAVVTSLDAELRPEIVIETCSLVAALLLVIVERASNRYEARCSLMGWVVEELHATAQSLQSDVLTREDGTLRLEADDTQGGLRFYYPHLSTSAVSAAVLSTQFSLRDLELVRHLHEWRSSAEECNARLAMAQLLLFFLPANEAGMRERLALHISIRKLPVANARGALAGLVSYLLDRRGGLPLPKGATATLDQIHAQLSIADPRTSR
jgi:hypothetical protein